MQERGPSHSPLRQKLLCLPPLPPNPAVPDQNHHLITVEKDVVVSFPWIISLACQKQHPLRERVRASLDPRLLPVRLGRLRAKCWPKGRFPKRRSRSRSLAEDPADPARLSAWPPLAPPPLAAGRLQDEAERAPAAGELLTRSPRRAAPSAPGSSPNFPPMASIISFAGKLGHSMPRASQKSAPRCAPLTALHLSLQISLHAEPRPIRSRRKPHLPLQGRSDRCQTNKHA